MNINFKQSQFELFPETLHIDERVTRPRVFFTSLTMTLENIISGLILVIMAIVLSYSLGVEKGKRVVFKKVAPALPAATTVVPQDTKKINPLPSEVKQETLQPPAQEDVNNSPDTQTVMKEILDIAYTIQVASFKNKEHAHEEATALKRKGYEIFVMPKGNYSIVCVGKFLKKDQAHDTLSQLKKKYKDCLVRRL